MYLSFHLFTEEGGNQHSFRTENQPDISLQYGGVFHHFLTILVF